MRMRTLVTSIVAVASVCTLAWGLGLPLQQTKEQLHLKYDLSAVAHGDQVLISLRIDDLGKLKPLDGVVLDIPSRSGKGGNEVYLKLATVEKDGKILASAQLSRDLAERATIELVPETPPDDEKIFGWVWYPIPVKDYLVDAK